VTHNLMSVSSCGADEVLPERSAATPMGGDDLIEVVVATGNSYVVAYVGSAKSTRSAKPAPPTQLPRTRSRADVVRRMRKVLEGMPAEATEPGAMDDLLADMRELAPGRQHATAAMMGDDE